MKVRTSITLPADLLATIDRSQNRRSAVIERALRAYFERPGNSRRDSRDIKIINKNAKRLNREARDVLEYQDLP